MIKHCNNQKPTLLCYTWPKNGNVVIHLCILIYLGMYMFVKTFATINVAHRNNKR